MKDEILRFAPSPTGGFHVGNVRTAVFNWIYVKKYGGKLLLRIEDTDKERSSQESIDTILDGFAWLGIDFDKEPLLQSQNAEAHRECAYRLLEEGKTYYCYCTPECLDQKRKEAQKNKIPWRYDGTCRNLSSEQIQKYEERGAPKVIRFKVPQGRTAFDDLVRGHIKFDNDQIGDFVIIRADGSPLYNLAVVVDDAQMGISLVMRAADHISNTPKQIMLFEALGCPIPKFVHLPLILAPDKRKLSKRHSATSILEYKKKGYLPEAIVNFLSLLGWSPGDDREKMDMDELIEAFSIEGISVKDAVFDEAKLEWLNSQYINDTPADKLFYEVVSLFKSDGLINDTDLQNKREWLISVVDLLKTRVRTLNDFVKLGRYFFVDPEKYESKGVKKYWKDAHVPDRLEILAERIDRLDKFNEKTIETTIKALAEELNVSAAKIMHPTRLALSGMSFGPGLFELMSLLEKETVIGRLTRAASILKDGSLQLL